MLCDAANDIEMLTFSGIGVAREMQNQKLKPYADYVTDDIDNDGWAKALKHYEIIDKVITE